MTLEAHAAAALGEHDALEPDAVDDPAREAAQVAREAVAPGERPRLEVVQQALLGRQLGAQLPALAAGRGVVADRLQAAQVLQARARLVAARLRLRQLLLRDLGTASAPISAGRWRPAAAGAVQRMVGSLRARNCSW
ncbi:MAG: hypothetical protein U5K43_04975 [Halofilum sp. (in: g-proteobacteria)]|nr:hypothetical protein [Halofilum sp. (in: g-proteobacteria)]